MYNLTDIQVLILFTIVVVIGLVAWIIVRD